jgi:hypothetical protein
MSRRQWIWRGTLAVFAAVTTVAALASNSSALQAAFASEVSLNIPPQPIETALIEFSRQTGLHIMLYSDYAKDITSPRLQGIFTPARALDELLAHTGLRYEYLDSQSIAVFSTPSQTTPSNATKSAVISQGFRLRSFAEIIE